MSKWERLTHDVLNFILASVLIVLGLEATGDWGKDWTAVAVSVLAIALKALNPKDDSYGVVGHRAD